MTRQEAIEILQSGAGIWPITDRANNALNKAIKALEQESVLDKIRVEIDEQYDRVHPYDISCAEGLEMALEIIDKYTE